MSFTLFVNEWLLHFELNLGRRLPDYIEQAKGNNIQEEISAQFQGKTGN